MLRRARTADELDALAHVLSGPAIGLDVIDETFTELWTAATSAVLGEIAAFTAFRHPGLDVVHARRRSTLPLAEIYVAAQTAAASSWFGRRRRLIAVRDRLAPYLRPEAKVKPKDVPALVEACGGCRPRCTAIAGAGRLDPGPDACPRAGTRSSTPTCSTRQVQWLRRAGARRRRLVALPRGSCAS